MLQAVVVIFAVVAAAVTATFWLIWTVLLWTARAVPILCVWLFWGFIWAAEMLLDVGYWIGERIASLCDQRGR